jgi:Predicted tRNA(5-methylaminomethyl-2-thiouridylate) methyltransferase, contains the PP-loop ATPase domain
MNLELNSIGLDKKPSDTKIIVAMSGGVDSFYSCRFDENARI